MTLESLKESSKRDLARMARERGIAGWHAMTKDDLIDALARRGTRRAKPARSSQSAGQRRRPSRGSASKADADRGAAASSSALATTNGGHASRVLAHGCPKDRIITMVRDPYWLHVYWELSRNTLSRAQAALGQDWHTARPILRINDVSSEDTTTASERHVRDIPIHGGVNNWYVDVDSPLRSYRVDIGYLSPRGKFFVLARSNVVTTPKAGSCEAADHNWADMERDCERIFHQSGGNGHAGLHSALRELFEERLRRPMTAPSLQGLGLGHHGSLGRKFHFEIDAELVVFGNTEPNARVTLQGEPVQVRPDGSFTVRFSLPDARQIIPAVATTSDGVEERTIILAVERNTKELEPMIHDSNEI